MDAFCAIPGELGMVYHPQRPHQKIEKQESFNENNFGATPDKVVDIYKWFKDRKHQVAIVIGETGSGKSTALPYWLTFPPKGVPKDFFLREGQILVTQPRILATTEISKYLGVLLGSSVGKGFDIGYRYSADRNADRFNAIFLATDGSLINMIKSGQIADLGIIMIDEAHERSTNIDIILRLLKDQLPLYPHLKLLIVSATINRDLFLDFFGKDTATVIEFEAKRKFDYKVIHQDENNHLQYENPRNLRNELVPALVDKAMWLVTEQVKGNKTRGHVLTFLHGVNSINEAVDTLRFLIEADPTLKNSVEVFPLYSDLSSKESDYALYGKDKNKIRIVVSTNVAEASVTVNGVVYVIESGVENQAQWYVDQGIKRVELRLISQANAKQRWGRSGRTAPGEVYTLYTKSQFESMLPFPIPAIQRTSMDEIILLLKDMGVDDLADGWIEGPIEEELARSYKSLQQANAIDEDGMLTEYGAMLREFAYSATLTDLIILSDRFGVAVEIATLLPIIKTGGSRRFLIWDDSWDGKTKKRVSQIHDGLMSNCLDDVEFILKLYSLWQNPPLLKGVTQKSMSLAERRSIWANEYYVDFDIFLKDIEPEKQQILNLLTSHRKDRNTRPVDFDLINRVRVILAFCVPFKPVSESGYTFSTKDDQSLPATYQLDLPEDRKKTIDKIRDDDNSAMILARHLLNWDTLFDDVEKRIFIGTDSVEDLLMAVGEEWLDLATIAYPIDSIIDISVKSVIKIGIFVDLENDQKGFIHFSNINPFKFVADATKTVSPGDQIKAKVIGYDTERLQIKLSLAIPENNPLNRHSVGDLIQGDVTNLADYGAFVNIDLGYSGMIHVSKLGVRAQKPSDILKTGDKVMVEIIDLREDRGAPRVALKLISKI